MSHNKGPRIPERNAPPWKGEGEDDDSALRIDFHLHIEASPIIERAIQSVIGRLDKIKKKVDLLKPPPGAEPLDTSGLESALPKGEAATAELDKELKDQP